MTAKTPRQMSHENLINYVRTRVAGNTPVATASTAKAAEEPHRASAYIRDTRVPAARIATYPKRRTPRTSRQARFIKPATTVLWDAMAAAELPTPQPNEPRYEDFLRTETRTLTTSAA